MKLHRSFMLLCGSSAQSVSWISRHSSGAFLLLLVAIGLQTHVLAEPGKQGTIFLERRIITPDDPSTFVGLEDAGQAEREIYDRRLGKPYYATKRVRLFRAKFEDVSHAMEVQVHLEFDAQDARATAEKYLHIIGQIPWALRSGLETLTFNKGYQSFAGGAKGIVFHVEKGDEYESAGILEEAIVHEATHAVLQDYSRSREWINAQKKDGQFISDYARDRPEAEDVAESYLMHLAVRYRGHRISQRTKQIVEETIPHRLAFFDQLKLNAAPMSNAPQQARAPAMTTVDKQSAQSQAISLRDSLTSAAAFEPGNRLYKLQTRFLEGRNKCLEGNAPGRDALLGGAAYMDDCQRVSGQQWKFMPAGDGYFRLQTMQLQDQNMCLEGGSGAADASPAKLRPCRDETGQFWKVMPANDGYFRMTTLFLESKSLCLEGGSGSENNSVAGHRPCRGVTGQLWKLSPH